MRNRMRGWTGALFVVIAAGAVRAQDPQSAADPGRLLLQSRIETVFDLNPLLFPWRLGIVVSEDGVTLSGKVPDASIRDLAAEIAGGFESASRLNNEIEVTNDAQPLREAEYLRYLNDLTTESAIRYLYSFDKVLSNTEISVSLRDGVATLSGTVPSESHRERARDIAYYTDGVDEIIDLMAIAAPIGAMPETAAYQPDADTVKRQLRTRLLHDRRSHVRGLSVRVEQSIVVIEGIVASESARETAGMVASQVLGVENLSNNLRVRPGPPPIFRAIEPAAEANVESKPPVAVPGDSPSVVGTPLVD